MKIESGWKATAPILDGEAEPVRGGWECVGCGRTLFVPACMASDVCEALVLCRGQGLLTAKMIKMNPERAWTIYRLTLPKQEPIN